MNKVSGVRVIADDIKLHFPPAMFKSSYLGIPAHQVTLPIEIFNDE